jgi:hypothetical protein
MPVVQHEEEDDDDEYLVRDEEGPAAVVERAVEAREEREQVRMKAQRKTILPMFFLCVEADEV